jgi:hypothetical protein
LRTEKFWASTCFWARSIARDTMLCSIGTPSPSQPLHQAADAVRPEDAHQVVFEREIEA